MPEAMKAWLALWWCAPVFSVTFVGPYTITYVHAEDAPQRRTFPFGY